jgi:hypothetical protein
LAQELQGTLRRKPTRDALLALGHLLHCYRDNRPAEATVHSLLAAQAALPRDTHLDAVVLGGLRTADVGDTGQAVAVLIDGKAVGTIDTTQGDRLTLPVAAGRFHRIQFKRLGKDRSPLRWHGHLALAPTRGQAGGNDAALAISLEDADGKPTAATQQLRLGERRSYRLVIDNRGEALEHVAVDLPRPAGCSISLDHSQGTKPVFIEAEQQRHLVAYSHLPPGRHVLTVSVQARHAGLFRVPAVRALPMYDAQPHTDVTTPQLWSIGR